MTIFLDKMMHRLHVEKLQKLTNVKDIFLITLLIILFIYTFRSSSIYSNVVYLTCNLKEINIIPSQTEIIKNIYPVFNEENYSFAQIVEEDKVEIEKEPKVVIDNIDYGKIDIVDKYAARNYINNLNTLPVSISNGPGYEAINISSTILIKDFSDLPNINYNELISRRINLTKSSDNIFIYSTHASETYANSDMFKFSYTTTYRTTDSKYNMISVSEKLSGFLKEKEIETIHDITGHDYGSYTNSYGSSRTSILANKEKYGEFGISIDVHRDAIEDLTFAPKVIIGGKEVAQCMLVIGVGYDGARNEYYDENLALAIKLMALAEKVYPGLFRPMIIRNSVYNQDLNNMSILIEVGATGNTLDESYRAVKCLANLLDILYID